MAHILHIKSGEHSRVAKIKKVTGHNTEFLSDRITLLSHRPILTLFMNTDG